jgi:hypothetical protein
MPTHDFTRSRWWMPSVCLFLGALMFAAFAIGDHAGEGVVPFAIMAALAAMFAFGARSETLQGLGGPDRDERWELIDLRATALSGFATILFVIGGFLYEVANGEDGQPWSLIGAIAGLSYIAAVVLIRRRS